MDDLIKKIVEGAIEDMVYRDKPKDKHVRRMEKDLGSLTGFPIEKFKSIPPPPNESGETESEIEKLDSILVDDEFVESADDVDKHFENYLESKDLEYPRETIKEYMPGVRSIILQLKYHYNRPRPGQIAQAKGMKGFDPESLKSASTPSYPSGHATQGRFIGRLLGDIYPEHKEQLIKIGNDIAYSRNMAKVHYPSDSKFGKKLGDELYDYVSKSKITETMKRYINERTAGLEIPVCPTGTINDPDNPPCEVGMELQWYETVSNEILGSINPNFAENWGEYYINQCCIEEEEVEVYVAPCTELQNLPEWQYEKFCDKCETDDLEALYGVGQLPWMGGPYAQFDASYCECCGNKGPELPKPINEQMHGTWIDAADPGDNFICLDAYDTNVLNTYFPIQLSTYTDPNNVLNITRVAEALQNVNPPYTLITPDGESINATGMEFENICSYYEQSIDDCNVMPDFGFCSWCHFFQKSISTYPKGCGGSGQDSFGGSVSTIPHHQIDPDHGWYPWDGTPTYPEHGPDTYNPPDTSTHKKKKKLKEQYDPCGPYTSEAPPPSQYWCTSNGGCQPQMQSVNDPYDCPQTLAQLYQGPGVGPPLIGSWFNSMGACQSFCNQGLEDELVFDDEVDVNDDVVVSNTAILSHKPDELVFDDEIDFDNSDVAILSHKPDNIVTNTSGNEDPCDDIPHYCCQKCEDPNISVQDPCYVYCECCEEEGGTQFRGRMNKRVKEQDVESMVYKKLEPLEDLVEVKNKYGIEVLEDSEYLYKKESKMETTGAEESNKQNKLDKKRKLRNVKVGNPFNKPGHMVKNRKYKR